jgi:hypothetical protein
MQTKCIVALKGTRSRHRFFQAGRGEIEVVIAVILEISTSPAVQFGYPGEGIKRPRIPRRQLPRGIMSTPGEATYIAKRQPEEKRRRAVPLSASDVGRGQGEDEK